MNPVYNEYDESPVHKTLKQRKKKKLKKRIKILLVFLIVVMISFYLFSDYSKVKSIEISGLDLIKEKDILEHISIDKSSYYWLIDQKQIIQDIKELPAIKKAWVHCDWQGHMKITVEEARPIAYAQMNNDIYEINDLGHIIKINDHNRINQLKVLPFVSQFTNEKLLIQFAEGFKDVPSLMQNEISDIILESQKVDPTRLKCLTKEGKIIYIRIEDLKTRLNDDEFNYEAYKTEFTDKCTFSFEGKNLYFSPCQ